MSVENLDAMPFGWTQNMLMPCAGGATSTVIRNEGGGVRVRILRDCLVEDHLSSVLHSVRARVAIIIRRGSTQCETGGAILHETARHVSGGRWVDSKGLRSCP